MLTRGRQRAAAGIHRALDFITEADWKGLIAAITTLATMSAVGIGVFSVITGRTDYLESIELAFEVYPRAVGIVIAYFVCALSFDVLGIAAVTACKHLRYYLQSRKR